MLNRSDFSHGGNDPDNKRVWLQLRNIIQVFCRGKRLTGMAVSLPEMPQNGFCDTGRGFIGSAGQKATAAILEALRMR